jgi:hypothetical protein
MFWYDLKLWQIFKVKHKIWKILCTFNISPNLIVKKHMTYWGNYKYNIYKFSKHFIWKFLLKKTCFFGKNDPKKDNSPKCKANTLVRYMLLKIRIGAISWSSRFCSIWFRPWWLYLSPFFTFFFFPLLVKNEEK